jgi:hypothetical protein
MGAISGDSLSAADLGRQNAERRRFEQVPEVEREVNARLSVA